MDKKLFKDLIASVREAGRISRGEIPATRVHAYSGEMANQMRRDFKPAQLVKTRRNLHMSQSEFADVMLIPKATLQSWEQGRRKPEGPALVLITLINKNPSTVINSLHRPTKKLRKRAG